MSAPGENGEVPKIILTPTEKFQAFKPHRASSKEDVLKTAWRIGTEPLLYRTLVTNPYTPDSLQTIAQRFPHEAQRDVLTAIALAEPEGSYDREFKQKPHSEQREALHEQISTSADMQLRFRQYIEGHKKELWDTPPEDIYESLTNATFGTTDIRGIEQQFSQRQRRAFRLAMVNFIEDLQQLKPYKDAFDADPKQTTERVLKKRLQGNVRIESLPVGFNIYLDNNDFKLLTDTYVKRTIDPSGFVLSDPSLPQELVGKVALIVYKRRGTPEDADERYITRGHELEHILFHNFFQRYEIPSLKYFEEASSLDDFRVNAVDVNNILMENFKDEVNAYFYGSMDRRYLPLKLTGGGYTWIKYLDALKNHLWKNSSMSAEEKAQIYALYQNKFIGYIRKTTEYQWVAQRLYKSDIGLDKAHALLSATPVDKVHRLGKYFGVNPEDIHGKFLEDPTLGNSQSDADINNVQLCLQHINDFPLSDPIGRLIPLSTIVGQVETIVTVNSERISSDDVKRIRTALADIPHKVFLQEKDRIDEGMGQVNQTIQVIDALFGKEDFLNHKPLAIAFPEILGSNPSHEITHDQLSALMNLLQDRDPGDWLSYFKMEYINRLRELRDPTLWFQFLKTYPFSLGKALTLGWFIHDVDINSIFSEHPEMKEQLITTISDLKNSEHKGDTETIETLNENIIHLQEKLQNDKNI